MFGRPSLAGSCMCGSRGFDSNDRWSVLSMYILVFSAKQRPMLVGGPAHVRTYLRASSTAHSLMLSGQTAVNALTQSNFEYRRREKSITNRMGSATCLQEKPLFFCRFLPRKVRCGRVVIIEFRPKLKENMPNGLFMPWFPN